MNIVELINSKEDLLSLKPLPADMINKAEKELGLKFNDEYIEYVKNFGAVVFEGHEITGVCEANRLNVVKVTEEERKYNNFVPNDWYVIESLGIDGVVVWQNENGEIYQTIPNGNIEKIYDSLYEYIEKCE